jgi:hypothetical protein
VFDHRGFKLFDDLASVDLAARSGSGRAQREPADGLLDGASGFFELAGPALVLEDDFADYEAAVQATHSATEPHRLGVAGGRKRGLGDPNERTCAGWACFVPLDGPCARDGAITGYRHSRRVARARHHFARGGEPRPIDTRSTT